MNFFRASHSFTAMNRMVKEQTGRKGKLRYKWVDPMKEAVRTTVETLTENLLVEYQTKKRREMMIALLAAQDGRIAEYQTSAMADLNQYVDVFAKFGDRGRENMAQLD